MQTCCKQSLKMYITVQSEIKGFSNNWKKRVKYSSFGGKSKRKSCKYGSLLT